MCDCFTAVTTRYKHHSVNQGHSVTAVCYTSVTPRGHLNNADHVLRLMRRFYSFNFIQRWLTTLISGSVDHDFFTTSHVFYWWPRRFHNVTHVLQPCQCKSLTIICLMQSTLYMFIVAGIFAVWDSYLCFSFPLWFICLFNWFCNLLLQ